MRRIATGIAAVLAVVLLPLGLLSSWVAGVVTDTDRYVSTVGPLAEDEEVKKATIALLERQATEQIRALAEGMPVEVPRIGDQALKVVVRSAATAVVESPAFAPAWKGANRSAHRQLVRVLEGDDEAVLDSRGRVSLELGTVLNTVLGDLKTQGLLPQSVPEVQASFALVKADDLSKARSAYDVLDALGFWLPVLWLVALVAAVVLSSDRLRLLGRLGIAGFVVLVLLRIALALARGAVTDSSVDGDVTGALWDVLTDSLYQAVFVGIVISLLVTVASMGVGRARSAR